MTTKVHTKDHLFIAPPPGLYLEGETESGSESDAKAEDTSSSDDPDMYPLAAPPPELSSDSDEEKGLDKERRAKAVTAQSLSESDYSTCADDKVDDSSSSDDADARLCIGSPPGLSLEGHEEGSLDTQKNSSRVGTEGGSESVAVLFSKESSVDCGDTPLSTKKAEAHMQGECRPCAYFWARGDGCRRGDDCDFCHLCDRDALKKAKKAKKLRLKAEAAEERARLEESEGFKEAGVRQSGPALVDWSGSSSILEMYGMHAQHTKAPKRTPLSAQSKPYVPATSAVASYMDAQPMINAQMDFSDEVQQLVEQYVVTGEKLLASLGAARDQMMHQLMMGQAAVGSTLSAGQQSISPDVDGALMMQLDKMAKHLDAANGWGKPSHGWDTPSW